jgi:hypothetical protein
MLSRYKIEISFVDREVLRIKAPAGLLSPSAVSLFGWEGIEGSQDFTKLSLFFANGIFRCLYFYCFQ